MMLELESDCEMDIVWVNGECYFAEDPAQVSDDAEDIYSDSDDSEAAAVQHVVAPVAVAPAVTVTPVEPPAAIVPILFIPDILHRVTVLISGHQVLWLLPCVSRSLRESMATDADSLWKALCQQGFEQDLETPTVSTPSDSWFEQYRQRWLFFQPYKNPADQWLESPYFRAQATVREQARELAVVYACSEKRKEVADEALAREKELRNSLDAVEAHLQVTMQQKSQKELECAQLAAKLEDLEHGNETQEMKLMEADEAIQRLERRMHLLEVELRVKRTDEPNPTGLQANSHDQLFSRKAEAADGRRRSAMMRESEMQRVRREISSQPQAGVHCMPMPQATS